MTSSVDTPSVTNTNTWLTLALMTLSLNNPVAARFRASPVNVPPPGYVALLIASIVLFKLEYRSRLKAKVEVVE